MPYLDNSLPNPLCFIPPNGIRGSEITTLLTLTIPDSIRLDILSALARSFVQMLAPRPNSLSLANFTASL